MMHSPLDTPTLPLPAAAIRQLQLCCDVLEMLRDVDHACSHDRFEGPWLPEPLHRDIKRLLKQAEEVY